MEKRSDEYRLSKAALTRMAQRQWSSQTVDKKSWLNWSFNQNFQKLKKKKFQTLHTTFLQEKNAKPQDWQKGKVDSYER